MKKIILGLLILGFVVRLIYILKFAPSDISIPSGDALGYHILAKNLLQYSQFAFEVGKPTARREPLYPVFLAIVYRLFGESLFIARLSQVFINVVSIFLIYLIAKEIFDELTAVLSVAISSFWPNFIYFCGALLREIFFMFFVLLEILMLIRCTKTQKTINYVFLGIISALMALIKTEGIAIFVMVCIYLLINKFSIKKVLIMCISFIFIFSLWVYRNYRVFKTVILGNTWGGLAFWSGTDILPFEIRGLPDEEIYKLTLEDVIKAKELDEIEENKFYYERAFKYYLENPVKIITLPIKKFLKFWRFLPHKGRIYGVDEKKMIVLGSISIPVFILFFIGIIFMLFSRNQLRKNLIVLIPIVALNCVYCIFFSQIRYRIPIEPFVIMISSFTLNKILNLIKTFHYERNK